MGKVIGESMLVNFTCALLSSPGGRAGWLGAVWVCWALQAPWEPADHGPAWAVGSMAPAPRFSAPVEQPGIPEGLCAEE